jgi:cell division protein FtsQ
MSNATAQRGVASSATRFRDRAIARRRRPWLRALVVVLVLALLAGAVWAVGWSSALAVRQVEVSGVDGAERRAVAALVEVPEGTPLARVDTAAVEARVRTRVTVAEVSVRRAWPGTLHVQVVPRTAAVVVRNPQGRLEVVDATGVSFGVVKKVPAGIPVVTATGSRGTTPEAMRTALTLLEALPEELAGKVSEVTVSSADLVRFTLGKRTVVWGGADDAERKVAIILALLGTKAEVIDVSAPDTPVTR